MQRFVLGLVVGAALGAGGFYAVDREVWNQGEAQPSAATVAPDAGAAEVATKSRKRRKRKRRRKSAASDQPIELSAADRAPTWKGAAIKVPDRSIDMTGDSGRPLSDDEISAGVGRLGPKAAECVATARGSAELTGDIQLVMLVSGEGRVSKVRARAPRYLHANGLYACLRKVAKGTRFAATGAATRVSLPLHLQ